MEKKPRKKKPLDIKLDTKNVDVSIKRDENGNLDIDVDTKVIDVKIAKDDEGLQIDVTLDDKLMYEFVANGNSHHMPKGTVWKITGEMAKHFIKRGFGKLK